MWRAILMQKHQMKRRATTSEAADEAASGATKKIASERAADAPCEYPVYVRDYAEGEDRLFADDFYGFLEKF